MANQIIKICLCRAYFCWAWEAIHRRTHSKCGETPPGLQPPWDGPLGNPMTQNQLLYGLKEDWKEEKAEITEIRWGGLGFFVMAEGQLQGKVFQGSWEEKWVKNGEFEEIGAKVTWKSRIQVTWGKNDSVAGEIWKGGLRCCCSGCVYNNEVIKSLSLKWINLCNISHYSILRYFAFFLWRWTEFRMITGKTNSCKSEETEQDCGMWNAADV